MVMHYLIWYVGFDSFMLMEFGGHVSVVSYKSWLPSNFFFVSQFFKIFFMMSICLECCDIAYIGIKWCIMHYYTFRIFIGVLRHCLYRQVGAGFVVTAGNECKVEVLAKKWNWNVKIQGGEMPSNLIRILL